MKEPININTISKSDFTKMSESERDKLSKRCNKCEEYKFITEFYKDSGCKFGLYPNCKLCKSKYASERYSLPNIKKKILLHRKEYQSHPEIKKKIKKYKSSSLVILY